MQGISDQEWDRRDKAETLRKTELVERAEKEPICLEDSDGNLYWVRPEEEMEESTFMKIRSFHESVRAAVNGNNTNGKIKFAHQYMEHDFGKQTISPIGKQSIIEKSGLREVEFMTDEEEAAWDDYLNNKPHDNIPEICLKSTGKYRQFKAPISHGLLPAPNES